MIAPAPDLRDARDLLIVKLSAMGDVIHALPVSAAIGRTFPQLRIHWVVEEFLAPLLSGNPFLASVITVPKLRLSNMRVPSERNRYLSGLLQVRRLKADIVLDLQGLAKSALIAGISGARTRLGYHYQRECASLVVAPVRPRPTSVHVVDQLLDVAAFVGADIRRVEFPLVVSSEATRSAGDMLSAAGIDAGSPFVSINPAAGHPLKQWRPERFAELAAQCAQSTHVPVVLVTADTRVAAQVMAHAGSSLMDLSGKTDLAQLAAVLQLSSVHVSGDTGSAHLAAALKTPVVCLVGPTDADRIGPYGQRENVVSHSRLCDPGCSARSCRFEFPRCLDTVTPEEVRARIDVILNSRRTCPDGLTPAARA